MTQIVETYRAEQLKKYYRPILHYWAMLTPFIALFTIIMGALTTTKDAGMAFRDWPGSDGHNMITYPILNLLNDITINRESLLKFLEHGHRLAGLWIGIVAIILAGVVYTKEHRKGIFRFLGIIILFSVIIQGLLGGFRVYLNSKGLAAVHGIFAALVFSIMCLLVLTTSRRYIGPAIKDVAVSTKILKALTIFSFTLLILQYILGSLLRHHGKTMYEHIGIGILGLIMVVVTAIVALCSDSGWIRRGGMWLLTAILVQFSLGWGAFATKYGIPSAGIVANIDSIEQIIFRTSHMLGGVLMMTAITLMLARIMRIEYMRKQYSLLNLSEDLIAEFQPESDLQSGNQNLQIKTVI